MFKEGGYAFTFDVNGITQERSTFTCCHCNRIVFVKPKCDPADLGGMCKRCMKLECPDCVGKGCLPFEKQLEQKEKRDIALRSYGV